MGRQSDLEGWFVRQVSSAHSTPEVSRWVNGRGWVGEGRRLGTVALTSVGPESYNGLLKFLGELSSIYGYRPRSSKISERTYRWTWERVTADGHRVSDMIIASKIEDH